MWSYCLKKRRVRFSKLKSFVVVDKESAGSADNITELGLSSSSFGPIASALPQVLSKAGCTSEDAAEDHWSMGPFS